MATISVHHDVLVYHFTVCCFTCYIVHQMNPHYFLNYSVNYKQTQHIHVDIILNVSMTKHKNQT